MSRVRLLLAGALLALATLACAGPAVAAVPRVLVVFLPAHQTPAYLVQTPVPGQLGPSEQILQTFGAEPTLSLGLLNPTQGPYSPQQALLDMTQGTRVSLSTYSPTQVPPLLLAHGAGRPHIGGWPAVVARADAAPQTIEPGLLAGTIPGGAAYVGVQNGSHLDAVLAADRSGRIARLDIGPAATVAARTRAALARSRLVVTDLPPGPIGPAALSALLADRDPDRLVIAIETPPDTRGRVLLPIGMTGPVPARGLTSPTTTLPGLVAGIDIAPTVLQHLAIAVPSAMRGRPMRAGGKRSVDDLLALKARLTVASGRRNPTLQVMVLVAIAVLLALGALLGWARGRLPGMRVGGLAFMWLPVTQLLGGLLQPKSGFDETLLIVCSAFVLAALNDRLLPWPRGPMLPAFSSIVILGLDAALGTHLLVQSILGPNPAAGSRFFGIGNELKSGLTCLLLVGLAAAFGGRPRSRRMAAIVAGSGLVLGVILGSARLGAGVGGVIIVAAGVATATLLVLPGRPSRWAIALAVLSPVLALGLLAGLDLLTAGGEGHLTHNVLHGGGSQNLIDIVTRRLTLAWQGLTLGGMPLMVAVTGLAVVFAVRNPWLYDRVRVPMWRAALIGGLVAGIVGSFAEDSGPLLFVVAVFVLVAATAYVQGAPDGERIVPAPD